MSKRTAGFGGEEIDGFRAMFDEGIDAGTIKAVAGLVARYVRARSGVSCMPQALASEVPGIHSQPPDRAVVPPNLGSFSMTKTFSPCAAAVTAALIPDAPDPITRTSHSYASWAAIFDILSVAGSAPA